MKPQNTQKERPYVSTRNACKLCAPLGASLVFKGIEGCVPLIHGSQGCSTYIRRYVISHFKEPIDIASSNFSESSAIFGGGANLKTALDNLTRQYAPAAIGIATTCLSETIGDDVGLYINEYRRANRTSVTPLLIHASTPSYSGTHMEGFQAAARAAVEAVAEEGPRHRGINLIPGFLSAEDLRHLKEIVTDFGIAFTMLPDYSETMDGESWAEYQKLPQGGTPVAAIKRMGSAEVTIQLGRSLVEQKTAGSFLRDKFGVKSLAVGLPIGIRETDRFFQTLLDLSREAPLATEAGKCSGPPIPEKYCKERGRLIDSYIDGHKYVSGKRAVIYGEADFVTSMASFLDEIGIIPVVCATGAVTGTFKEAIRSVLLSGRGEEPLILEDSDFATMLEATGSMGADLIVGNSKGYYLSKRLGVPLVRAGFPIHDRLGGQRILHVGYRGTQQLFDRIANALIEFNQDSSDVGYSYM